MSLAPTYNPKNFEDQINQKWQSAGVGAPENQNLIDCKPKVLFATTNAHKIRLFNIAWIAQGLDQKYQLLTLKDFDTSNLPEVAEDSGTFEGDALLKAQAYAQHFGIPTISQDRGFVFDALNWPGTDSKKVMFGSDQIIHTSKEHWESLRDENTARALAALDKIQGKSKSMRVVQGLAIALPGGAFAAEKYDTVGLASEQIVTKFGGSFDWFFIPDGLGHILAEFDTQDELEIYQSKYMYPITPKIIDFLEQNLNKNEPYSILMPPPNLTGDLHAGHAFQHYIMDTLTRVHRQKGQPSLWYPGVDHAGIQLEGVIDKLIKKGEFDEILTQKLPEILEIPTADRPKWLKNTDKNLWTELAWSRVNSWRDNQKKQSSVLGDTPDYERSLFTLDDRANNMVNFAFQKYWQDGLIYKGSYLINWSVGLQTAVSDVAGEIEYEKRIDPFVTFEYEIKEIVIKKDDLKNKFGLLISQYLKPLSQFPRLRLSTVRPETKFTDLAVAMHPSKFEIYYNQELFYSDMPGFDSELASQLLAAIKSYEIEIFYHLPTLHNGVLKLIFSEKVDPNFGTGILKITPVHDQFDYDIYQEFVQNGILEPGKAQAAIGRDGKLTDNCGKYAGLTVEQGRLAVIKILAETGYIPIKSEFLLDTDLVRAEIDSRKDELDHFDPTDYSYTEGQKRLREILGEAGEKLQIDWKYEHNVTLCERSKTVIEPLISEEFFLSYHHPKNNLQKIGLNALEETNFYPSDLKDRAQNFLENIKDWCISRDLVWGHKMPIWYNFELNPNKVFYSFEEYQTNLEIQKSIQISSQKPTTPGNWVQEEKILDTWFSSCLWPLSTLDYFDFVQGNSDTDFEKYYSTTDMISGADIFYQWIIRMMMVCKYFTDKTPYKNIILNPTVRDEQGRKMSKSLGNGLDAVKQIDKYSSDSLRLAMLSGMIPNRNFRLGGNIADKMCEKYRNFGNKLWNVARFLESKETSN